MSEILTVAQIEARIASQWVLVEDPVADPALQVQSGRVLAHSNDRDAVYREAVRLRPSRFAVLYTGTLPEDTAIVV